LNRNTKKEWIKVKLNVIIFFFKTFYLLDYIPRKKVPKVLLKRRDFILDRINFHVLKKGDLDLNLSEILLNEDLDEELRNYLNENYTNTYLKTIYISQISWKEDWKKFEDEQDNLDWDSLVSEGSYFFFFFILFLKFLIISKKI
jgi:hypothetical protein